MKVELIGHTTPVVDGLATPEDLLSYCARVSNPANQLNTDTGPKLIRYLINRREWSPLEMVHIVMKVTTTRDIARQILRHRSFSFQEFSQRYADPTKELNFIIREARLQDTKDRQNSIEVDDADLQLAWESRQGESAAMAYDNYKWALDHGIAKEVARSVLPEGMTESVLFVSGSVRSWYHYCQLRMEPKTQKEHREIAIECWKILNQVVPAIIGGIEK